mgnify:CR=1 FL=1
MPKITIPAREIEYDVELYFLNRNPFSLGERINSGIRDDNGVAHHFDGYGVVVHKTESSTYSNNTETYIYLKVYPKIDNGGKKHIVQGTQPRAGVRLL